jgi:hypothetical protein
MNVTSRERMRAGYWRFTRYSPIGDDGAPVDRGNSSAYPCL